jgi:hypothetical protein
MTVRKSIMKPIYEFRYLPILASKFYKFQPNNLSQKILEKELLQKSKISKFDMDYYKNNKHVFFYYNNDITKISSIISVIRFTYHSNQIDVNDYNKYYYSNMETKIKFENNHYNIIEKVSYLQNKYNYESNIDYSLQIYKIKNTIKFDLYDCNTIRIANLSFYNTLNELDLNNCKMFNNYNILLSEDNQKLVNNVKKIINSNSNDISIKVEYDKM